MILNRKNDSVDLEHTLTTWQSVASDFTVVNKKSHLHWSHSIFTVDPLTCIQWSDGEVYLMSIIVHCTFPVKHAMSGKAVECVEGKKPNVCTNNAES